MAKVLVCQVSCLLHINLSTSWDYYAHSSKFTVHHWLTALAAGRTLLCRYDFFFLRTAQWFLILSADLRGKCLCMIVKSGTCFFSKYLSSKIVVLSSETFVIEYICEFLINRSSLRFLKRYMFALTSKSACASKSKYIRASSKSSLVFRGGQWYKVEGCQRTGAMHPWYAGAPGNKFDLASVVCKPVGQAPSIIACILSVYTNPLIWYACDYSQAFTQRRYGSNTIGHFSLCGLSVDV